MLFPLAVATHQTELGKLGSHLGTFNVSQYPGNFSVVWDHAFSYTPGFEDGRVREFRRLF